MIFQRKIFKKYSVSIKKLFFFLFCAFGFINAQTFIKVTDASSPFVTETFPPGYRGASWVDYDNNGTLDLFENYEFLFKNNGNLNFESTSEFKGRTTPIIPGVDIGSGNSWADYDNDGDIDLFFTGSKSFLFKNEGGTFTKITSGAIGDSSSNRGWTSAWGDYDNDGNVDLLIVHPRGFIPGAFIPNLLFHNDGPPNYTFTKVTGYEFLTKLAPYTVGIWSDYDLDGDIDLFIGSGPAGTPGLDYLYKNMLKETGSVDFQRITSAPIGTDMQDGQVWNWIDYDNDGDLDGFLTNYTAVSNRFYKNNNGNYVNNPGNLTLSGIPCLANSWGDFDNDGYLDVIITSDFQTYFFHNNGNGTFAEATNIGIDATGNGRSATLGDIDNDGDLDLYISGFPTTRGLYINQNANGKNWLKLNLVGTVSNKSAIGARVNLKANVSGKDMWQMREVSAQNTFNGQSSLTVHFGLGDASIVDSLVILWPSGNINVFTNFPINKFETITEGGATGINDGESFLLPSEYQLEQNYPNTFNPATTIKYSIPSESFVKINIYNSLGQLMDTVTNTTKSAGNYEVVWNAQNVSSGVYFYSINSESISHNKSFFDIKKMIVLK